MNFCLYVCVDRKALRNKQNIRIGFEIFIFFMIRKSFQKFW